MPTTQPEEKFTRIYDPAEDRTYKHTTTVRHQGNVIAFAMDNTQQIFYSVLNFERGGISSPLDVNYWDNDPRPVNFPNEIGEVGFRAGGLRQMPVVLTNGAVAPEDEYVEPNDIDPFLSTTARLSADAPFEVLSDGEYLYLFRQAVSASQAERNIYIEDSDGEATAIVDNTLLVDRFIYRNGELAPKLEVRFQRSRRIDQPASRKDTLGNTDLENKPFYEPTHELKLIRHLEGGNFTITLLPTALPKVQRWQIFAYNSASGRIDSFNIERASGGLFNTKGTRYYTSPVPAFQNDVLERKPGTDPFSGEPLIPQISTAGFAEFALNFNGIPEDAVIIDFEAPHAQALAFPDEVLSFEAWIKTATIAGTIASYAHTTQQNAFVIADPGNLQITLFDEPPIATNLSIADGSWHHLAVTWDNTDGLLQIFVDGRNVTPEGLAATGVGQNIPGEGVLCFGQRVTLNGGLIEKSDAYSGMLDDVRLWRRTRLADELLEEKNYRLIGNESDLVGYWRFDEGDGNAINDQTDNAYHGALDGEEPVPQDNTLDDSKLDETALVFDGTVDEQHHVFAPFAGFPSDAFTIEFWLKSDADEPQMVPISYANADNDDAVYLFLAKDLRVSIYGQYSGPSDTAGSFTDGTWHHCAVTWANETGELRLYRDGLDVTPVNWADMQLDHVIKDGGSLVLGHEQEAEPGVYDQPFLGSMNEVRIWNRVRSQAEIVADKNLRLDPFRNDLVFCIHTGTMTRWVFSDAPIGDHPGVRRSSFAVAGRQFAAGMSAQFYYEQEQMSTGYNAENDKPMKRNGRIMLAAATIPIADDGTEDYVAALDFGITKAGKLAQVPDLITLDVVDRQGGSQGGESIDYLLEKLRQLKEEQAFHKSQIDTTINDLSYERLPHGTVEEVDHFVDQVNDEIEALGGDTGEGEDLIYKFDAVMGMADGYMFFRGAECLRTDTDRNTLTGYPKPISEEWPALPNGWTSDFNAVTAFPNNTFWFFKGDAYVAYSLVEETDPETNATRIDHEVADPVALTDQWTALHPDFERDLDAVIGVSDTVIGMFKGLNYLTADITDAEEVSPAGPIAMTWTGLPDAWLEVPEDDEESRTRGINAAAGGYLPGKGPVLFNDYEFIGYNAATPPEAQGAAVLLDDSNWPNVVQLFGIDPEPAEEDVRLQNFYYLKEKLTQLGENYSAIEETEALIESDIYLPMPLVHFDPEGHWISGALLGFAWTADGPELFESINGRLNLYFRGKKDQFFVAYYDVLTGRATYPSQTASGDEIEFVSRLTGVEGDALLISIEAGAEQDTCSVTLAHEGLGIQETWLEVPRMVRDFANVLHGLSDTYDYAANAHGYPGYFKPEDGSRLVTVIGSNPAGDVEDGVVHHAGAATRSAQWFASSPGNAISLNSPGTFAAAIEEGDNTLAYETLVNKFAAKGDLAMEAWINPVHSSDDIARIVAHHSSASTYSMGIKKVGDSQTAKPFDGSINDTILIPMDNFPADAVTIEFWARAYDPLGSREGTLFSYATADENNTFTLFNHKDFNLYIQGAPSGDTGVHTFDFDPSSIQQVVDNFPLPWHRQILTDSFNSDIGISTWHHYAITWRSAADPEPDGEPAGAIRFYKNGVPVHSGILAPGITLSATGTLSFGQDQDVVGGRLDANQALRGQMDEFRVWSAVRTQEQIQDFMRNALSGSEEDLAGYWRLEGDTAVDLTLNGNDGVVQSSSGSFELTTSPVQHFVGFAAIGERTAETLETLPPNRWQHLAAVYNQSYALDFDGINDWVDCGSDITLDLNGDLTVEAIVTMTSRENDQGIITRGRLADGTDQHVPYALRINKAGRLVFSFEDESGTLREITGPDSSWRLTWLPYWAGFFYRIPVFVSAAVPVLATNQTYRVAVTREKKRDTQTRKDSDGNITSVNPREWWDINFYINGEPAGYVRYEGTVGSSSQAVEIGRAYDVSKQELTHFTGQISEVRLWNQARDGGDINGEDAGQEIKGNEKGLVSWWRFEENEGNIALDSKSANHGTRKGPKWVKNPDPVASKIYMYINGESTGTRDTAVPVLSDNQMTIGAGQQGGASLHQFIGRLDEVRIWRAARTQEQVQDNLFRRLIGERNQLIAHFDADENNADQLLDQSGRGLHLQLIQAEPLLSSAPISDETAAVRNALAGVKNNFHDSTQSRPGAQEYGDVQYDVDGNMIGVMKRCYSYIKDGNWHLVTGFKVGDLELEWIGQAQYDPQLMGFIEGPPPVPSENLTVRLADKGQDYANASSVEMKEAASTLQSYSITTDRGVDTSISLKAGVGFQSKTVAGIGVATTVEEADSSIGIQGNMDTSNSWLNEQMVGTGQTTNRLSRMDVQGAWEDPDAVAYPKMGRRYVPGNVGFALVQSETADVFAMRLKHPDPTKRVVVGLRMQPNPDIPKDWNIIIFPLNSRYVKQGTLDGKVGFDTDPDYPNAGTYTPDASYFKPIEAYALKNRIEREREELNLIYKNYDASPAGASGLALGAGIGGGVGLALGGPVVGVAAALVGAGVGATIGGATAKQKLPDLSRRNMVNTYVWTADGGLFSETEETMDVTQEVAGGSFSLSGMAGLYADVNVAISKVALKFELEAMMGGHLNLTNQKSEESSTSFEVAVDLDVERDVNIQSEEQAELVGKDAMFDDDGNPVKAPGKVDAYRFMTFYLQPDKENFKDFKNKVVDQEWLNSNDPNAVALSQAIIKENGAPWRILHRVTFVSRVLPEIDSQDATPTDELLKAANIESNFELIRQIEPYVINKTGDYQAFTNAVRDTVRRYLPELRDAEDDIVAYMALYFQVFDE